MRGPLFSGPVGKTATLQKMADLIAGRFPVCVFSAVWLGEALAQVGPVILLVEGEKRKAAMRARRRLEKQGHDLQVVVAGENLPLRPASLGTIVVDDLVSLEPEDARAFVESLVPLLVAEGLLLSLDGTQEDAMEACLGGVFLAGGLRAIGQERPRRGALVTFGSAPAPVILARLSVPT